MNNFTDKIRGLREDNDLTQSQVAAVLGTSQTMYARYERGANEMPIRHLVTLCRFYNVSADFLLDTAPNPHKKQKKAQHFCWAKSSNPDFSIRTTQSSQSTDLFPKKHTTHECIYTAKVLRTRYPWQGNAALAWCWGSIFFSRGCRLAPFVHHLLPDGVSEVCWNTAFSRDLLKSIAGWHSFEDSMGHIGQPLPHRVGAVPVWSLYNGENGMSRVAF